MSEITDYYNSIAKGYNELHQEEQLIKLQFVLLKIRGKIRLNDTTKVLDVGCGTGISSDIWVEKFNCKVTGIDPSKELIAQNTPKLSSLRVASAENIPYINEAFDVVTSFTAIQNFEDYKKGLDEIKRVGKNIFVLTVLRKTQNIAEIRQYIFANFTVREHHVFNQDEIFICY